MQYKTIFSVCGLIGCLASTSAFAVATDQSGVTHKATHRHHVARVHNTNTMTDVPQESAAPEIKPETPPEYFGHATGSDGGGS
jgi:hypothetical protein